MPDSARVAWTSDLAHGQMKKATVKGRNIILVNYLGKFYALASVCPHAQGPLDRGRLSGGDIICPWHGGRFSVKDGRPISGPTTESVERFEVTVSGDDILVSLGT